ncbi:hypothetical protein CDL15_Pgr021445 [Punica granatum]|uniref:Uncharacterized protein n=1 Tax=Punica granatum TaxID=22663 RepID=A0A218XNV4_PUNGR|nr:hypothetical protein CDL15_Pgr021445 [Punica granatum]
MCSVALVDALGCMESVRVNVAVEGRSALGPWLALPWRNGEDCRWFTREGWHDSPVVRKYVARVDPTFGHGTPHRGEGKTMGGLLAKVRIQKNNAKENGHGSKNSYMYISLKIGKKKLKSP